VSRRDELAAVIGEAAALSLVESEWVTDALLAWLGEQLGDEGFRTTFRLRLRNAALAVMREVGEGDAALATAISHKRASVGITAVREWFGVAE
jgi:hypothetical protein